MESMARFFGWSSIVTLILAIGSKALFVGLEYYNRQSLPSEMRTEAVIQRDFDGAYCLACDIGGIISTGLFALTAFVSFILWVVFQGLSIHLAKPDGAIETHD